MTGFEPAVTVVSKPFGLPSYFYPPLPAVPTISGEGLPLSLHIATLFQFLLNIHEHILQICVCAPGEARTPTPFRTSDPKSEASTNSATEA